MQDDCRHNSQDGRFTAVERRKARSHCGQTIGCTAFVLSFEDELSELVEAPLPYSSSSVVVALHFPSLVLSTTCSKRTNAVFGRKAVVKTVLVVTTTSSCHGWHHGRFDT